MLKIDVNVNFESVDCLKVSGRCLESVWNVYRKLFEDVMQYQADLCNPIYTTQLTKPDLHKLT